MTISPEVLDAMVAAGVTRDQLVAILKADYAAEQQREEERLSSKREGAAERQRRKRARDRAASTSVPPVTDVTHVTPVTRDTPSEVPPKDNNSNPPPTSPGSDADASAQPAGSASIEVRSVDQVWNSKAALADLSGKSEEAVGRWIGKALKDHAPEIVKQGIDAALRAGTRDPFSYARSVMLNSQGATDGQQATRNNRANSFRQPQESVSDKIAAAMGRGAPVLHRPQAEVGGLYDGPGRTDHRANPITIDAVANPTADDRTPRLRIVGHGGSGSGFGN